MTAVVVGYGRAGSGSDVSGLWTYEYDKLNRLTKAKHPLWPDQGFTYDHAGNRTEMTVEGSAGVDAYSYNNLDELTTLNTAGRDSYSYEWDARGNLGAVTGGRGGALYTFDTANRLRQAVTESGTKDFGYDSSGQRVYESMGGKDTWFVFDGLDTVMELDGTKTPKAVIVPGLCKTRLDLAEPFMEWYLHDGLGSVVQLTDAWGNLTQEYWYEPFGGLQKGVKDPNNRYRFVGLGSDDDLGLVYMNARWYEQHVGRFATRDPLEGNASHGPSLNRYSYALGNPMGFTDRAGRHVSHVDKELTCEYGRVGATQQGHNLQENVSKFSNLVKIYAGSPGSGLFGLAEPMPEGVEHAQAAWFRITVDISNWFTSPSYSDVVARTLAHEMAHVLWWLSFDPTFEKGSEGENFSQIEEDKIAEALKNVPPCQEKK